MKRLKDWQKNIVVEHKITFDCYTMDYEQIIHMTFSLCLLKLFANYKFIVKIFMTMLFSLESEMYLCFS